MIYLYLCKTDAVLTLNWFIKYFIVVFNLYSGIAYISESFYLGFCPRTLGGVFPLSVSSALRLQLSMLPWFSTTSLLSSHVEFVFIFDM